MRQLMEKKTFPKNITNNLFGNSLQPPVVKELQMGLVEMLNQLSIVML